MVCVACSDRTRIYMVGMCGMSRAQGILHGMRGIFRPRTNLQGLCRRVTATSAHRMRMRVRMRMRARMRMRMRMRLRMRMRTRAYACVCVRM